MTLHINKLPDWWPSVVGLDIEVEVGSSHSPNPFENKIATIQIGCPNGDIYVLSDFSLFHRIKSLLTNGNILKVIHNAGFDAKWLKYHLGVDIELIWDTFLMERLLTAGTLLRCDLASTVWRRAEKLIDKSEQTGFVAGKELTSAQLEYIENDVKYLIPIYKSQTTEIEHNGLGKIRDLEHDLLPVVIGMELRGICLDTNAWVEVVEEEHELANEAAQRMCQGLNMPAHMDSLFGDFVPPINLNSWQQVLDIMARSGIVLGDARDSTLKEYLRKHPNCEPVKAWREYKAHMKRTSWDYPKYINQVTGRVHTSYNQIGADTGRFSSNNPNLQNVPRDSRIRRVFVPNLGYLFICSDYSQQEMRVMAEVSGDKNLRKVCRESDPHLANARRIFNEPDMQELKGEKRTIVKNTGFAMNYGAGYKTFAHSCGIKEKEAVVILHLLRATYPDVFRWGDDQLKFLSENGYVWSIWGRRRWFTGVTDLPWSEMGKYDPLARNGPIQISSADMMKRAMVRIENSLKDYDAHLVLSVHDEVVVEVKEDQAKEVAKIVEREMEEAAAEMVKSIPCPAETKISNCWVK